MDRQVEFTLALSQMNMARLDALGINTSRENLQTTPYLETARDALASPHRLERLFQRIVYQLHPEERERRKALRDYLVHRQQEEFRDYIVEQCEAQHRGR